jgi:hypothetical protein
MRPHFLPTLSLLSMKPDNFIKNNPKTSLQSFLSPKSMTGSIVCRSIREPWKAWPTTKQYLKFFISVPPFSSINSGINSKTWIPFSSFYKKSKRSTGFNKNFKKCSNATTPRTPQLKQKSLSQDIPFSPTSNKHPNQSRLSKKPPSASPSNPNPLTLPTRPNSINPSSKNFSFTSTNNSCAHSAAPRMATTAQMQSITMFPSAETSLKSWLQNLSAKKNFLNFSSTLSKSKKPKSPLLNSKKSQPNTKSTVSSISTTFLSTKRNSKKSNYSHDATSTNFTFLLSRKPKTLKSSMMAILETLAFCSKAFLSTGSNKKIETCENRFLFKFRPNFYHFCLFTLILRHKLIQNS